MPNNALQDTPCQFCFFLKLGDSFSFFLLATLFSECPLVCGYKQNEFYIKGTSERSLHYHGTVLFYHCLQIFLDSQPRTIVVDNSKTVDDVKVYPNYAIPYSQL